MTTQAPPMGQPQNGQESQRGLTSLKDMASVSGGDVFWLEGGSVYHNGNVIKMNYTVTSLDRLVAGDKLAVKRQIADGSLRFLVNDEDCGKMISLQHIIVNFFQGDWLLNSALLFEFFLMQSLS